MKEITIKIKHLFDIFNISNGYEEPFTLPRGLFIKTPDNNLTPVIMCVKKHDDSVKIKTETGKELWASKKHLVLEDNNLRYLNDVKCIKTLDGDERIIDKEEGGVIDLYDISISFPHLYVTTNKIVHHNTYYCLEAIKAFLDKHEDGLVVYYDSESTLSKQMLDQRGIPSDRVIIDEVITIDEWGNKIKQLLDSYEETPEKERTPLMVVLDSLGQLTTEAEVENVAKGKNTRDMQKQQLIKKALRVCTVKAGQLNVPVFVTAHTYKDITAFIPQDVVAGGEALQYAASSIIMLSKAKDRQGTELVGNIITCKAYKSRFTKEGSKVKTRLRFDTGLDRYYGLLDVAEAAGIWKKVGTRYEVNGKLVFGKTIEENPTEYYTPEILDKINEYVKNVFNYGVSTTKTFDVDEIEKNNEEEVDSNENNNIMLLSDEVI